MSFVESGSAGADVVSRRQAWRHRAFRHQAHQAMQADASKAVPVQVRMVGVNAQP